LPAASFDKNTLGKDLTCPKRTIRGLSNFPVALLENLLESKRLSGSYKSETISWWKV